MTLWYSKLINESVDQFKQTQTKSGITLTRRILIVFNVCITLFFSCTAQATETIRILYASDMPTMGNQETGGYPQLATAVKSMRQSHPKSLFLFGGNSLGPSSMSMFDSGSHIIDLLNSIEPDVMAVTKREYSYYEEELSLRSYEALFPLVATNIEDPSNGGIQNGIAKHVLIQLDDVKIGVLAVVDPAAAHEYLLKRVIIQDAERSIRKHASMLKQQGADVVVLLYAKNFPFVYDILEEGVIDLALFKTRYNRPTQKHPKMVVIEDPESIALIDLSIDEQSGPSVYPVIKNLMSFSAEPVVEKQRNDYVYRLDRLLDLPLTQVQVDFETTRNIVRTQENSFANFITDALRVHTGADAAVLNSGVVRGDTSYKKGQAFTHKNLVQELPYRTYVILIKLLGKDLLDTMEISLSEYEGIKGKFPQLSNIQVQFDSNLPAFSRVVSIQVDGKPLQPDKTYLIATTDYLYNGGDGYIPLSRGVLVEDQSIERPILSDVVMQRALFEKRVTHPVSNRLVNLNE